MRPANGKISFERVIFCAAVNKEKTISVFEKFAYAIYLKNVEIVAENDAF